MTSPKFTEQEAIALWHRADDAGMAAAEAAVPTPMVVGSPRSLIRSLLGDDSQGFDPAQPVYFAREGVCGRARITIRPATSSFVRHMRRNGIGWAGYEGGWVIMPRRMVTQSLARYEAWARAAAEVLAAAQITCYVETYLD